MHVLVLGAAGMLGTKLADALVRPGALEGTSVDRLTLADVRRPAAPADFNGVCECATLDLGNGTDIERLIADRPNLIFHLAAIVSSDAEANFDLGYRVNLDGTRSLLEAIRALGQQGTYRPRLVFASSAAVYGGPFPDDFDDTFFTTPLTSYGTQKAICELLLADYSRRGLLDGIGLRFPTICIRPGAPNKAASGVFSNILREPLVGQEARLTVGEDVRHWFAGPRSAVGYLTHAATLDLDGLGARRTLNMPGLSVTIGDQIAALRRVAGRQAVDLIRREPDPAVEKIVGGWATRLDDHRARELGFTVEDSFDEIIKAHIEDELGGTLP